MNGFKASPRAALIALLTACLVSLAAAPALAQDAPDEGSDASESTESEDQDSAEEGDESTDEGASDEGDESDDGASDEDDEDEDKDESEHGSYEWKPSYGFGVEAGFFATRLDRWNEYLLASNDQPEFSTSGLWHFDFAAEGSFFEGTRFAVFGGVSTPFHSDPSLLAFYGGVEPAFAFRRDFWELALGTQIGLGAAQLELESGESANTGLAVVRPFIEVRRYFNERLAVYLRGGFSGWMPFNVDTEDLFFGSGPTNPGQASDLQEGGAFFALGTRFGKYPEHVKSVPDTDDDGYRDDVDDCPEEAEDFDEFEDDDGCPEADNDEDGIVDDEDSCPLEPEDKDGWEDEDGCPETDDDTDGDGILNKDDECVDEPEDKDGFQDEDGCPDNDNDNDGIADADDKCPDTAGVKQKDGCPFERVRVTMKKINISEKIFFDYNKATIKEKSYQLLNEVATVIKEYDRIKKIEVQGHTDHAGSDEYNQELSQKRAKSVHEYLVDQGVSADRLSFKGYGESKPLVPLEEGQDDDDESEEAAAKNRRVEFVILEQSEVKKVLLENEIPEDAAKVEEADDEQDDAADADEDDGAEE
jgi:outer membrane protein OmpA-like peptidoglycan-associated protein